MYQWKHLRVNHSSTGGHPLDIAITKASGSTQGIVVVYVAFPGQSDRLKTPVGVLRKPWHLASMVHPPTITKLKVRTDISTQ
jgi:hypothetical protein